MVMVNSLFNPLVAGIMMAAILAAIMSTADSQLLVAASAFTEDIYTLVFKSNASQKELVWMGRFTVVGISLLAYYFALDPDSSVLDLVAYAWAGFGATFGPIVLFSLFWEKTTRAGAIAGMLTGAGMVFIWKLLLKPIGGVFGIYELLPAFILSCIAIIIVSMLSKKPEQAIIDEFQLAEAKE
jgi:sodium/proline symporter